MKQPRPDEWRSWVQRLRAIAQTGLAYSQDVYDQERYVEITRLAESMLGALLEAPPERIRNLYAAERGYPTPKVDVRAGVFRDQQILLVREESDGRWSLPGGWADEQESPRQCVEREVLEEAGLQVRARGLVAVKDRSLHPYQPPRLEHVYKLFFLCDLLGGELTPGTETTDARFFPVDDLPPLSLGRTLPEDVGQLLRYHQQPALPPVFD